MAWSLIKNPIDPSYSDELLILNEESVQQRPNWETLLGTEEQTTVNYSEHGLLKNK